MDLGQIRQEIFSFNFADNDLSDGYKSTGFFPTPAFELKFSAFKAGAICNLAPLFAFKQRLIIKGSSFFMDKTKRRALILDGGGLKGAYSAGVLATLSRNLPKDYFDAIYMSSVGSYLGSFFASNQPDTIENTCRKLISGNQLANFFNLFLGKRILNLEYLTKISKDKESLLDIEEIFKGKTKLTFVVTNYKTGEPAYLNPTKKNIFKLMEASCALPLVHGPVLINKTPYFDGGLSDPIPFKKAIEDGYEEVLIVLNRSRKHKATFGFKLRIKLFFLYLPKKMRKLVYSQDTRKRNLEASLRESENVRLIIPQKDILKSIADTNKKRINQTIDLGIKDASRFLKKKKLSTNAF